MSAELASNQPRLPETPMDALGPTVRINVIIEGKNFFVTKPDKVDRLIDHPAVRAATASQEYMPFWADLWPASRMLGKAILHEPWQTGPDGKLPEVLEIGCGLGLGGVVALSRGLRVTFSDYDATALKFAANNALENGFKDFKTLQMDYRHPPEGLQCPVILGSDLIYEMHMAPPLAALIKRILAPTGFCLLTDQDRIQAPALREAMTAEKLTFTTQPMKAGEPGGRRHKGTLYRITHA